MGFLSTVVLFALLVGQSRGQLIMFTDTTCSSGTNNLTQTFTINGVPATAYCTVSTSAVNVNFTLSCSGTDIIYKECASNCCNNAAPPTACFNTDVNTAACTVNSNTYTFGQCYALPGAVASSYYKSLRVEGINPCTVTPSPSPTSASSPTSAALKTGSSMLLFAVAYLCFQLNAR
mmetsp:Transcript_45565/g.81511  ORF Transcript_45565/g.81511 Transcript_45565/m.81511 type:complete len:176 (-) Transcript_45565:568-1095(-)